jgi:hypothetical protein
MSSFVIPLADSGVSASDFAAAAGDALKTFAVDASADEVSRATAAVDQAIALVAAGHVGTDSVRGFISVTTGDELGNGAAVAIELRQRP